jgi:hypothetical protein
MIRRGFWLTVGAAGGIMGYRRASSLTRQVAETLGARPSAADQKRPGAVKRHWARETIRFTRDVREGMDLYIARHQRDERPSLDGESQRPLTLPFIAVSRQAAASHPALGTSRS